MPFNTASKTRKQQLESAAEQFETELRETLGDDVGKLESLHNLVRKLRAENAHPEHVKQRINACMKKYPTLCNRVLGLHADGSFRLRETEPVVLSQIPYTPPARFTRDSTQSIVSHLPYSTLGRLAQTCKWMYANISQQQVDEALKRARERVGRVEISPGPSPDMPTLRLVKAEEDKFLLRSIHCHYGLFELKPEQGGTYLGVLPNPDSTLHAIIRAVSQDVDGF